MLGFAEVLLLQDGMDVNTAGKTRTEGLGPIGSNRRNSLTLGFKEHGTFSVGVKWQEDGMPRYWVLGFLKATFWARAMPARRGRKQKKGRLPAEQRESYEWIRHAESAEETARRMPDTLQIIVGDRAADNALFIYKVAAMPHLELIVRAKSDRRLPGEKHTLFKLMSKLPRGKTITVDLCRKTERRNGTGKVVSRGRKARKAVLEILYRRVSIAPPPEMAGAGPLEITCVSAVEISPPKGEDMVHWHLLTTIRVETHEEAVKVVRRYHMRWIIEEVHGMLKEDGCDLESLAYRTLGHMKRAAAVYLVVAWRMMAMLGMVREDPSQPPDVLFDDVEQDVIRGSIQEFEKKRSIGSRP
jgi:hypothetical protein